MIQLRLHELVGDRSASRLEVVQQQTSLIAVIFRPSVAHCNECVSALDQELRRCLRYSELWTADEHRIIRDRVQLATKMLASGQLHISLVEAITGEVRDTFSNYLTLMLFHMNEQLNLDVLNEAEADVTSMFQLCLRLLPIDPIPELKLKCQKKKLMRLITS